MYRDEINLLDVELLGRQHAARLAAERAAAEASGAAQLQRLGEQLLQTRVKYNRAKYQAGAGLAGWLAGWPMTARAACAATPHVLWQLGTLPARRCGPRPSASFYAASTFPCSTTTPSSRATSEFVQVAMYTACRAWGSWPFGGRTLLCRTSRPAPPPRPPPSRARSIQFGGGGIFGACKNIDISEINGFVTVGGFVCSPNLLLPCSHPLLASAALHPSHAAARWACSGCCHADPSSGHCWRLAPAGARRGGGGGARRPRAAPGAADGAA